MKSRTHKGPNGVLWDWLNTGRWVWAYWNLRRVTSRYLLLVPSDLNTTYLGESKRAYVMIRWPEEEHCPCGHGKHPGTLCRDSWCMCDEGDPEREE